MSSNGPRRVLVDADSVTVGQIENFTGTINVTYATGAARAEADNTPAAIPPCPYKGLAFFGPEDADRYFGREASVERLAASVEKRSLTALVGASGSGKSSVVLAGLAPQLLKSGAWRVTYFRIGAETDKNPFRALARALAPLSGPKDWAAQLEQVENLADGLASGRIGAATALGACRTANPGRRILVIADQFKEVFTLVANEGLRGRFVDWLLSGFPRASGPPDVALALTLRADFYEKALLQAGLAEALQDRVVNLAPMSREELRVAIERPALPVTFESGLIDTLLDEAQARPGALPQLQFALTEMWGRLAAPEMTWAAYKAIGGVEGALRQRADAIYARLTADGADADAVARFRALFTRLVSFGECAADTRRVDARDELGADVWRLAQDLAGEDSRLVVVAAAEPGKETVEIAHEALIANWPALRGAIEGNRAFGAWLKQCRVFLDEHRKNPDDEGGLLRGGALAVALEWLEKRSGELSAEEAAFIQASGEARDRETRRREAEWRERERLVAESREAAANLRLAEIAAEKQLRDLDAARLDLQRKQAGLLGELAHAQLLQENVDAALRLATRGARDALVLPDAANAPSPAAARLAEAVWNSGWRVSLGGHLARVTSAAFSPDGARVVTASDDETARVWDAATGREIAALRGHEGFVNSAAFSPDGARVVTASSDKTARVWDVRFATMSVAGLIDEVCHRRLPGVSLMTRDEMRLAGYPEDMPPIDVCEGVR